MKVTEILNQIQENKKSMEFLPTGFNKLDYKLDGGLMKKELIVIGGQTGIGKSYLAGQLQYNIATKGFKTAYFSLEISNNMVVSRLVGSLSNIKSTRIMAGHLLQAEEQMKHQATGKLKAHESSMDFFDNLYVYSEIEEAIKKGKYDFVVLDFIQNVMIQSMEEYAKLSFVALSLQKLAKEVDCCILVLSQLSNSVAREKNKTIPEYKGSGAIAMVCDLGFYIERGDRDLGTQDDLLLILAKNRRGSSNEGFQFRFKAPGGWIYEH